MTERVEPPAGMRAEDGWHRLVSVEGGVTYAEWLPRPRVANGGYPVWRIEGRIRDPDDVYHMRYRYDSSVPTPAEIDALVKAARRLDKASNAAPKNGRFNWIASGLLDDIAAALAPFKEITDAP